MVITVVMKRQERTITLNPRIELGTLWLPIRPLVEGLGGQVAWNDAQQAIIMTLDGCTLEVAVGQPEGKQNGEMVALSAAPITEDGTTMMTWYDLAQLLPVEVQWTLAPAAAAQPLSGVSICLDPGHGGGDPGALGPSGLFEKDVSLSVGLKLRDLLQQVGARVVMTRADDTAVSLSARAALANGEKVNWFVSIHCNSAGLAQAHGTETYCYAGDGKGGRLAAAVQAELVSALGRINRGVKTERFFVLGATIMPAILTELAFISNPDEEKLLAASISRERAAEAIYRGILAVL